MTTVGASVYRRRQLVALGCVLLIGMLTFAFARHVIGAERQPKCIPASPTPPELDPATSLLGMRHGSHAGSRVVTRPRQYAVIGGTGGS